MRPGEEDPREQNGKPPP